MKVVLDNSIVLDALLERKHFYAEAEQVLTACVGEHTGYLTANSLTDIYYVLAKAIGAARAKQAIRKLIELFEIISITEADCIDALELPTTDFEDALVSVCAMKCGADCIVTRDREFATEDYPVKVVLPAEFLKSI